MKLNVDYQIPFGASAEVLKAIKTIVKTAGPKAVTGQQTFYSPEEWAARGEKFGTGSLLVIVHDGGDLAKFFNYDYTDYKSIEKMDKSLAAVGLRAEQCTCWYSAIYRD